MKAIVIIAVCLATQLCHCQNTSNTAWSQLETNNFKVRYPASWKLDETGKAGSIFFIFAPPDSTGDPFFENLNLVVQNLQESGIDLDKFVEISESQVKTMMANSQIIKSARLDGNPACHEIVFSGTSGIYKLKFRQFYWLINKKSYVLTFTATQNSYSDYLPTAEKIMDSFKLKIN